MAKSLSAFPVGPGAAMIVGNLLPVFLDHKTLQPTRWIGISILFAGLIGIGFHRQESADQSGDWVWLGDLGFIATGALRAVFGYLLDRWKVNAFTGVGQVVILSAFLFAPLYFLFFDHHQAASLSWVTQVFYQGGLGGFLGLAAYALTVARLGPGPASLLSAFVPSSAILLAIPLLGAFPSPLEIFGVFISTIGLLTAINLNWWPRWR